MIKQIQDHDTGERTSLALIFLVSFTILSLVSLWLIYQQFAQVFTRNGQCRVLAVQTRDDTIDLTILLVAPGNFRSLLPSRC